MLVREAMTTAVVTVTPETTTRKAAALLADHRITAMPVVGADGNIVGIVSEADVVRDALMPDQRAHLRPLPVPEGPAATYVSDVMTPRPVTVGPDNDLADAVQTMIQAGFKSLPVTEHGRVVGVVSRTDVVSQLARRDGQLRSEIDELFRAEDLGWQVDVVDGVVTVLGATSDPERRLAQALAGSVRGVVGVRFSDPA